MYNKCRGSCFYKRGKNDYEYVDCPEQVKCKLLVCANKYIFDCVSRPYSQLYKHSIEGLCIDCDCDIQTKFRYSEQAEDCPVCFETDKLVILPCQHRLCRSCTNRIYNRNQYLARDEVLKYVEYQRREFIDGYEYTGNKLHYWYHETYLSLDERIDTEVERIRYEIKNSSMCSCPVCRDKIIKGRSEDEDY